MSVDPVLVPEGPVSVALGGWQSAHHGLAYIIVAKAEFALLQGECALLGSPGPVHVSEELGPQKPRVDVMLVGSAYAERPAARLVAYMAVGPIEKALEVCSDRWVDTSNALHQGALFKSLPLTWERAAGGPDTVNPVGVRPLRTSQGKLILPNLQPLAVDPSPPDWTVPPASFGPMPRSWPVRASLLGGLPAPNFQERPVLPDDFNFAYLQAAPHDQQAATLDPADPIFLEGLHPALPKITTKLPRFSIRAFVDESNVELPLTCDTFLIDTDAQRITVLWKGSAWARDVSGAAVRVQLSGDFAILAPPASPPKRGLSEETATLDLPRAGFSALPFADGPRRAPPPHALQAQLSAAPSTQTISVPLPPPPPRASPTVPPPATVPQPPMAQPPPMAPPPAMAPPPVMAPPAAVSAPAPSAPPRAGLGATLPSSPPIAVLAPAPVTAPPMAVQPVGAPRIPPPPVTALPPPPDPLPTYLKDKSDAGPPVMRVGHAADAAKGGAYQASLAAAGPQPSEAKAKPAKKVAESIAPPPGDLIELLWFHPDAPTNLPKRAGKESEEWLPRKGDAKAATTDPDRARVGRALARSATQDQSALKKLIAASASTDGVLQDSIGSCRGELTLTFDPFELLAVTLALAEPHAATDRRLKEALEQGASLKDAPKAIPVTMLENAVQRVRQAFANATTRQVPPDYLQTNAERWLAEERKYTTRMARGESCIVGALAPAEGGPPIPVLLPASASGFLPGIPSFGAKVFGRASLQLDGPRAPQLWVLALAAVA